MGRAPHLGFLGIERPRDHEISRDAIERCDLERVAERSFRALSGGERQRVLLARALVQEARLLLLDEPTAYLDLKHRLAAYDLLTRLRREGNPTIVVVSHDINLAARYCDRLVLLRGGAIVADGAPHVVLTATSIRDAYEVDVEILTDSSTGRPLVVPLSAR
jgi:iron complex transport system ATP-binding protein